MNLYRYYQHDGFRCETIVGIVKAKDMQEAEKNRKKPLRKSISRRIPARWLEAGRKLSFPMMDAAKFITGD